MRPDEFFLRDIVIACRNANKFAGEVGRDGFERSDLYQSAIQYNLLVIGEAASKISRGLRSRYKNVDWRSLKDFRNVLAHDYFALDTDVIWDSATKSVIDISAQVTEILSSEFPDFPVPKDGKLWK